MIGECSANPGPIDNSNLLEGINDVLSYLIISNSCHLTQLVLDCYFPYL